MLLFWKIVQPFSLYIIAGIAAFFLYTNHVDNKVQMKILKANEVALNKARDRIEFMSKVQKSIYNKLEEVNEKDIKETTTIINRFNKEPNSDGSSGIDGKFVR